MSSPGRYYKPTSLNDGLVVRGQIVRVPKVPFLSYLTDPSVKLTTSGAGRDATPREHGPPTLIVQHTTTGKGPQEIIDGRGPVGDFAERNAVYWHSSDEYAGAHVVVDMDGSGICTADLALLSAMGSGKNNDRAVQIETVAQKVTLPDGKVVHRLYRKQIAATVTITRAICQAFGIPLQVQLVYRGKAIGALAKERGPERGVIGHRDCSNGRGRNDPGDAIMQALVDGADGGTAFLAVDFGAR